MTQKDATMKYMNMHVHAKALSLLFRMETDTNATQGIFCVCVRRIKEIAEILLTFAVQT
jgi:hypothetical protein